MEAHKLLRVQYLLGPEPLVPVVESWGWQWMLRHLPPEVWAGYPRQTVTNANSEGVHTATSECGVTTPSSEKGSGNGLLRDFTSFSTGVGVGTSTTDTARGARNKFVLNFDPSVFREGIGSEGWDKRRLNLWIH